MFGVSLSAPRMMRMREAHSDAADASNGGKSISFIEDEKKK
jgi:hypothetical protein